MNKEKNRMLLVIDVQNDFCPGGSLAVHDGDSVVPVVNRIASHFDLVVATQDWHPENHVSFAKNHPGRNVHDQIEMDGISQVLWPTHCVAGTHGADFHPALNAENFQLILRKGTKPSIDSYSAFMENDKKTVTGLEGYLKGLRIENVYVCGLATDYCVFRSVMDSVQAGFKSYVVIDGCRGVNVPQGSVDKAIETMKENGVLILHSSGLL
jgi:nicotinamidase/pyrazinamidase